MSIILSEELERIKQAMRDWFSGRGSDCRIDFLISLPGRLSVSHADISVGLVDVPTHPAKCPLVGVDRKWLANRQNDAIDPLLTLQAAN